MKKNYLFFLLFCICCSTFVYAQTEIHTQVIPDKRLYEAFEESYLESLITENPFLLQRWNFYLDYAWYITDLPSDKISADNHPIHIEDPDQINIFLVEQQQKLQRSWDHQMAYRIAGSDLFLVLHSGKKFNELLNLHLGRNRNP